MNDVIYNAELGSRERAVIGSVSRAVSARVTTHFVITFSKTCNKSFSYSDNISLALILTRRLQDTCTCSNVGHSARDLCTFRICTKSLL